MRHPCKKCLVRAACSLECKEWKHYANNAAELMTFVSIMLSAIIMGPLIFYIVYIGDTTNAEWPSMAITFIWIFSFMSSTIIQAPYDKNEQIGFITRLTFAPFCVIWLVIIHSTKNYFRRA
jgi:hypothetical protein